MKILRSATATSVLALLLAASAVTQAAAPEKSWPSTDSAAPPAATTSDDSQPAAAGDNSADKDKDDKDNSCRWCMKGKLADPWTLPQPDFLKDNNITVGGWLEGGIYGNQYGAASNGPIGMRSIGDGFTADQVWGYAERKTDTKGCGWDIGGRVDYVFGVDGPQTQCFGDHTWDYGWNTSQQYGSAMPQLYARDRL